MDILGDDMEKYLVIKKFLKILTPKWDNVALVIEETKDLSTLEFDYLFGYITSYYESTLKISNVGASKEHAFSYREN